MKETYLNPEMEIFEFSAGDVIATSDDSIPTTVEWVPRVNEGAPYFAAWGDL